MSAPGLGFYRVGRPCPCPFGVYDPRRPLTLPDFDPGRAKGERERRGSVDFLVGEPLPGPRTLTPVPETRG